MGIKIVFLVAEKSEERSSLEEVVRRLARAFTWEYVERVVNDTEMLRFDVNKFAQLYPKETVIIHGIDNFPFVGWGKEYFDDVLKVPRVILLSKRRTTGLINRDKRFDESINYQRYISYGSLENGLDSLENIGLRESLEWILTTHAFVNREATYPIGKTHIFNESDMYNSNPGGKNMELDVTLNFPEHFTDDDIVEFISTLSIGIDKEHRSFGGSGVKLCDSEFSFATKNKPESYV